MMSLSGYEGYENESPHRKGLSISEAQAQALLEKYLPFSHLEETSSSAAQFSHQPNIQLQRKGLEEYITRILTTGTEKSAPAASDVNYLSNYRTTRDQSKIHLRKVKRGFNNTVYQVTVELVDKTTEATVLPHVSFALRLTNSKTWSDKKVRYEVASMQYIACTCTDEEVMPVPRIFAWGHPDKEIDPDEGWSFILMEWKAGHVLTPKLWNEVLVSGPKEHHLTTEIAVVKKKANDSSSMTDRADDLKQEEENGERKYEAAKKIRLDESAISEEARQRRQNLVTSIVAAMRQLSQLRLPPSSASSSSHSVGVVASYDVETKTVGLGPSFEHKDPATAGPYSSAFQKSMLAFKSFSSRLRRHAAMPESKGRLDPLLKFIEPVQKFGEGLEDVYAAVPVCAIHGDFCGRNLLVDPDTGKLTGVLDWEWLDFYGQHAELQRGLDDVPEDLRERVLEEGGVCGAESDSSSSSSEPPLFFRPGANEVKTILRFEDMYDSLSPWTISAHFETMIESKERNDPAGHKWDCDVEKEVQESVQNLTSWLEEGKPTPSEIAIDKTIAKIRDKKKNEESSRETGF